MGLTSPSVQASASWPEAGQGVPSNACLWLHLRILGGAFAEVELTLDGAPRAFAIFERGAPYTAPHPGIPMPTGWAPQPGPGLYALCPEDPLPVGARGRITVRTLAGHDGPFPGTAGSGPFSVRPASRPPSHVHHRSEPALALEFVVEAPRAPGEARLRAEDGAPPLGPPGAAPPAAPFGPPGHDLPPRHSLHLSTTDAPVFVCWESPWPKDAVVRAPGAHLLVHEGEASTLRVRVWSWAGVQLAKLEPKPVP